MFDFGLGTPELLVIAMVALIIIGPKDLPKVLKTMGRYINKIKGMAREFQDHLDDAAKETGVSELKDDLSDATSDFDFDFDDLGKQDKDVAKVFEDAISEPDKAKPESDAKPVAKKKAPAKKKSPARKTTAKKRASKPAKKAAARKKKPVKG